jgi:O-antigen/teichoic acid export membrane protein
LALDAAVSIVASFGLSVMVARGLGPDVLGVYSYAMWLLAAATAVATTGVTAGMQQFAAERLGRGDFKGAAAVLNWGLPWQLGLAALLVTLGTVVTLAVSPAQYHVPLVIAVASVAPGLLVSVPAAGLGAAQAYAENVVPSMIAVTINVVVAAASLAAGWSLTGLTIALLLSRSVDLALRYVAWRRVWRGLAAVPPATASAPLGDTDVLRMRRFAWRSSVLLLIDMIVWDRSEYFVLMYVSPPRELAFYALSFNIVQQALTLPKMLSWGLSANLLVERGRDPGGVVRLSRDAIRYVFLLAAPLTLGLAAIDRAIMPLLYGRHYAEAIPVLTVVAGLAVLRGALVPVQELLRMSEQQAFLIRFGVVMSLVNIGLDLWLIPRNGAIGAAWANGIAQAMATAGLTVFASRRLGLSVPLGDMGRILLACVPMVLVARVLGDSVHHWPAVLIAVPLGAGLYAAGIRWLGVLRPQDGTRLASLDRLLPSPLRPAYHSVLAWMTARGAAT